MDSKAYKYLVAGIIGNSTKLSDYLPIQFKSYDITLSDANLKVVAYFLSQLIPESESNDTEKPAIPPLLDESENSFFSILFRTAHQELAQILTNGKESANTSFKRNGTELLTFLCHAVSLKWIPIFSENDPVSFAMSCFLIEVCMHVGWCPNAFENRAKRAAHIYFSTMKKSLYHASDTELSTILGYLQSAWLCAQKTEGIQDKVPEWEHNDLIRHYSWEISRDNTAGRTRFTMYRLLRPLVFIVVPKCSHRISHPFKNLINEGKIGLTLFSDEKPIKPTELTDYTSIDRLKFKGERLTYSCTTSTGQDLTWIVAIQIFRNTVYRIDVIQPKTESCDVSRAELRLENSILLSEVSNNKYLGEDRNTIVIEFIKNPFNCVYLGQEERGISYFQGGKKRLTQNTSVEMTTAWARGKDITSIDRTNLLGIFDISQ